MYTQCPACDSFFRISIAQLKLGQGKVRCGACDSVFNALLNLTEQLPEIPTVVERVEYHALPAPEVAPSAQPSPPPEPPRVAETAQPAESARPSFLFIDEPEETEPPRNNVTLNHAADFKSDILEARHDAPQPESGKQMQPLGADLPAIIVPDRRMQPRISEIDFAPDDDLLREDYVPAKKPYGWFGTGAWFVGTLGLLILLIAQYAFFMRDSLAQYPTLRPGLEFVCSVVNTFGACEIPLRRDTAQIQLLDRDLRPHPAVQDALIARVTLVNQAPFRQPYPALQLTISDLNGVIVAKRLFQPSEYLDADVDAKRGMAPRAPAPVVVEVATPSIGFQVASWDFALF
ncbi:MAG: zinc-ribbon and DUF3426 domain-containing protein [Pseudomonadota bacterium]